MMPHTSIGREVLFFFQAEDGIRDIGVTGVQTCALPICSRPCGIPCSSRRARRGRRSRTTYAGGCERRAARARTAGRGRVVARAGVAVLMLLADRKSVVFGMGGDLGGRRIIKKIKENG